MAFRAFSYRPSAIRLAARQLGAILNVIGVRTSSLRGAMSEPATDEAVLL